MSADQIPDQDDDDQSSQTTAHDYRHQITCFRVRLARLFYKNVLLLALFLNTIVLLTFEIQIRRSRFAVNIRATARLRGQDRFAKVNDLILYRWMDATTASRKSDTDEELSHQFELSDLSYEIKTTGILHDCMFIWYTLHYNYSQILCIFPGNVLPSFFVLRSSFNAIFYNPNWKS